MSVVCWTQVELCFHDVLIFCPLSKLVVFTNFVTKQKDCISGIFICYIKQQQNGPSFVELRKEITQSACPINFIQKFRFLSTDLYLHPENQSQVSIQEILKIKVIPHLIGREHALACPFCLFLSLMSICL